MRGIRRYVISLIVIITVAGALLGLTLVFDLRPRLGLDLRGGLSVTLTAPDGTREDVLNRTVEVLRDRIDKAGVAEPEISQEGTNNVLIQLPGTDNPERLLELIGRTAQLQFRQVMSEVPPGSPGFEEIEVSETFEATDELVASGPGGTKVILAPAELTGDAVQDADAIVDTQQLGGVTGSWSVSLRFRSAGSRAWTDFTGRLACLQGDERRVAIVLDGEVASAPQIAEDVVCEQGISGGTTSITGGFSEEEAKDLALVLTTGALPVELEQSEVRTVSPTLGRDSLRAGLIAGGLGLALVMLYVLVYYRALGLQTWIGLLTFAVVIYGLVVGFGAVIGWNLTLAGIAGLIVSIGIATDSYIVFFERVKEEVHTGKTIRSSMDRGFTQAWRTLRAANAVTILAAVILYLLAVGPVRGFALALGMATTVDLAIFAAFTWPLAALLARNRFFAEGRFIGMRRALEGGEREGFLQRVYRSEFDVDFIGRRKIWFAISGILITVAVLVLIPGIRGLEFGIDFRGGAIYRAVVSETVDIDAVRSQLAAAGQQDAVVQVIEDRTTRRRQLQVQTPALDEDAQSVVLQTLADAAGVDTSDVDFERVGEKWGRQITQRAIRGLAVFIVLVIIYMSFRLEPKMALSGLAALLHDVLITAGVYALVGFQVSPASIIALLTILGYSLYDTVVVFDKIRENTAMPINARRSYSDVANESMNQVLMRSINTSLTTLLPVGSLLFVGSFLLGADTLRDLALALFVGIAAGTYSSLFVASPILSMWKEREPRYVTVRAREVRTSLGPSQREVDVEESDTPEEAQVPSEPEIPVTMSGGNRVQYRRESRKKRKRKRN